MSRARTSALLALACGLLLVGAGSAQAQGCAGADIPAVAGNEAQMNQATLCLLNQQRAAAGLVALTENAQLDQTSTAYSRQMIAQHFFDHVSPAGVGLVPRLTAAGYLPGNGSWNAGENIAWGQGNLATPQSIMAAWMRSTGHRENILSRDFTDVGLGVAIGSPVGDSAGAATYTTDFGHHVVAPSTTALSPYQSATPAPTVTVNPVKKPPVAKQPAVAKKSHARRAPVRCARTAVHGTGLVTHSGMRSACRTTRARTRRHAAKR